MSDSYDDEDDHSSAQDGKLSDNQHRVSKRFRRNRSSDDVGELLHSDPNGSHGSDVYSRDHHSTSETALGALQPQHGQAAAVFLQSTFNLSSSMHIFFKYRLQLLFSFFINTLLIKRNLCDD